MDPELLTILEVSERLKVSRTTVYTLMNSGKLRSVYIGSNRRVYNFDLIDYMSSLIKETINPETGVAVGESHA